MQSSETSQSLRVLLVPDNRYWICGTIAEAIAKHNPSIDATIYSGHALLSLPNIEDYIPQFDLVHFLTPHVGTSLLENFKGRIPMVTTVHHVEDNRSTETMKFFDCVMTASTEWVENLVEMGLPEFRVWKVPYGVDSDIFRPPATGERESLRREFGLDLDSPVVGFIGKKTSDKHGRKGTDIFIDQIRDLGTRILNLHVLIVGPGWDEFVSELNTLGIQCTWIPFVIQTEDFAKMYRCLDVYWCTSRIEGGPVPVLEAMSTGVSCVSTPVGMVPEVILDGENGILAPFEDLKTFSRGTAALLADESRMARIGAAARSTILEKRRWTDTAKEALPLYQKAIENFQAHPLHETRTSSLPDVKASFVPLPRGWLEAREHLSFMNFLVAANQEALGKREAIRAVRSCPTSHEVWRKVAHLLPAPQVANLIGLVIQKYDGLKRRFRRLTGAKTTEF